MVFEWDDFGANHKISDQCQSHDCRDQLLKLREINPAFKATLFAIPAEMTMELLKWCEVNSDWIELAYHGFFHSSNYECEKMSYRNFDYSMRTSVTHRVMQYFVDIFRAPGWQISDDVLSWLKDHDYVVADQAYNDHRRPEMKTYLYNDATKEFSVNGKQIEAYHGHTWDVGWNGIYEDFEKVSQLVADAENFNFVSEVM